MEIIDAVLEDKPATEEELRYGLVAFQALATWDREYLLRFAAEDEKDRPTALRTYLEANESFKRWKHALAQDPKVYTGWNNDPANPEYQHRRKIALKLFDKAMKGELPKEVVKGG